MEHPIRVLATPEAYKVIEKFEAPIARCMLYQIFSYARNGFFDDRNGLAVLFPQSPPYFRIFHSPGEPSTVLITDKIIFDDLEEILESSIPVPLA